MKALVLAAALLGPGTDDERLDWDKRDEQRPPVTRPVDARPRALTPNRPVLTLEMLLAEVKGHFPPLLAALTEREAADGDLLAAQGKFDLTLRAKGDIARFGYYENQKVDIQVDQPLQWNGMSLFSGYRYGEGDFPVYDLYYLTKSEGEWRGGVKQPLLRGRSTDSRRAELKKAQIGQRLADLSIDAQKISVVQGATRAYWAWVAAGSRYQVAQRLLQIARTREAFLEESVHLGQMAPIEITDNKRQVAQREAQLAEADRYLQQAAIDLSLFHRDSSGNPVVPGVAELPPDLPGPEAYDRAQLPTALNLAVQQRPELARLTGQAEQLEQDLKLARNDALPQLDLYVSGLTERGGGPVYRGPQDLKTGISFELPLQRRTAKGKQMATKAKLEQVRLKTGYAQNQVQAEVRDAVSALTQAFERAEATRVEVQKTREVEDAERTRYELGEGTLFVLNLRELQTAEAELRLITAKADYQRAKAQYDYALASALTNW